MLCELSLHCDSIVCVLMQWDYSVVWCGVVSCTGVWCSVLCCGVLECGVVWCGVVWCGVVWCAGVSTGLSWCNNDPPHMMLCGALQQMEWMEQTS